MPSPLSQRHLCGFLLLLLLGSWIQGIDSQTCEIWDGHPAGCVGYLGFGAGTALFVPQGKTLQGMSDYVASFIVGLKFALKQPDCLQVAVGGMCMTYLRPCALNGSYAFPVEPCGDICSSYVAACSPYFPILQYPVGILGLYHPPGNGPHLTCNETDPFAANQTFWPAVNNSNTLTLSNGSTFGLPCTPELVGSPDAFGCAAPLVPAGSRCAFACPIPAYTSGEYESAQIMQNIVTWFSWAGSSVLITSLLLFPPARSFPKVLILLITIAANIACGALLLPTFAGYDETWCGGSDVTKLPSVVIEYSVDAAGVVFAFPVVTFDSEELTTKSSLCTFQGAMLQFGYLASTFWWAMIAFNMALELLFGSYLHQQEKLWKIVRLVVYNIIGWGLPFFLMVIPSSAGAMGFEPGATYCFLTEEDNFAWILTFFFLPVGFSLLIGITCFAIALIKIFFMAIKLRKFALLLQYFRLAIFIGIFLFIYTFIFTYVITISAKKDEIVDGYGVYFGCLLVPLYANNGECNLSDSVSNYGLAMVRGFAICSLGWLLFFNFMSWELMVHWAHLFKDLYLLIVHQRTTPLLETLKSGATVRKTHSLSLTKDLGAEEHTDVDVDEEDPGATSARKDEQELDNLTEDDGSSSSEPADAVL